MAKGAVRLGHADLKEQKYMELLAGQLGVIKALVAKMDAITGNQRLEDAIDVKSDVTRDPSEKSPVINKAIADGEDKTNSPGCRANNDSIAKGDVSNDSIGQAKPGIKVRKLVFDISLALFLALVCAFVADSIKTEAQSFWDGVKFVVVPVKEILSILATLWTL